MATRKLNGPSANPKAELAAQENISVGSGLAVTSVADTLSFFCRVVVPTWSKGILLRRRGVLAIADRLGSDAKAVGFMQKLRRKYEERPLLLRKPGRPQLLLFAAADAKRVLDRAPRPFAPASYEKRVALAHFEPHVSLISRGPQRTVRRALNDDILESNSTVHSLSQNFLDIVRREATQLLGSLLDGGELTWPIFTEAWFNAVRCIVLGKAARTDRDLTEMLSRLRANANWAFFRPVQKTLRSRYYARLNAYLAAADPASLAGLMARRPPRDNEQRADQVTQWLFAFDGGAMTAFRALALLASHPQQAKETERDRLASRAGKTDLPYLRAAFVEAVRLWPTTSVILRESTQATLWGPAVLPKGAGLIIYVPFFNRDDERLGAAHRFEPQAWLGKDPAARPPFLSFSDGPAACPGRHLVAFIGSAWLAALLDGRRFELLVPKDLGPNAPLPVTLDHFSVRFRVSRHG